MEAGGQMQSPAGSSRPSPKNQGGRTGATAAGGAGLLDDGASLLSSTRSRLSPRSDGPSTLAMSGTQPFASRLAEEAVGLPLTRASTPQGPEDMAEYIQTQMTCILRPFADRVRDLQASLEDLSDRSNKADERASADAARYEEISNSVQHLKGSVAAAKANLTAMSNHLKQLGDEKASLEEELGRTKATLSQLDSRQREAAHRAQELRSDMDVGKLRAERFEAALQESRRHFEETVPANLHKAVSDLEELKCSHHSTCRGLERNVGGLEDLRMNLQDLSESRDKQRAEDEQRFQMVRKEISDFRTFLQGMENQLASHRQGLEQGEREVGTLRNILERVARDEQEKLKKEQQVLEETRGLAKRFVPVEEEVWKLLEAARHPNPNLTQGRRPIYEVADELRSALEANLQRLQDLDGSHKALEAQTAQRGEELQNRMQELQGAVGSAESSLRDLRDAHSDTHSRMDAATASHREVHGNVQVLSQRLDGVAGDVSGLQTQLAAASENMAKMRGGLDMCNAHFTGLRRGFRQAETRVLGTEDALLPMHEGRPTRASLPSEDRLLAATAPSRGYEGPQTEDLRQFAGRATVPAPGTKSRPLPPLSAR